MEPPGSGLEGFGDLEEYTPIPPGGRQRNVGSRNQRASAASGPLGILPTVQQARRMTRVPPPDAASPSDIQRSSASPPPSLPPITVLNDAEGNAATVSASMGTQAADEVVQKAAQAAAEGGVGVSAQDTAAAMNKLFKSQSAETWSLFNDTLIGLEKLIEGQPLSYLNQTNVREDLQLKYDLLTKLRDSKEKWAIILKGGKNKNDKEFNIQAWAIRANAYLSMVRQFEWSQLIKEKKAAWKIKRDEAKARYGTDWGVKTTKTIIESTPAGREKYGASKRTANALQLRDRVLDGFSGKGDYYEVPFSGEGGYLGRAIGTRYGRSAAAGETGSQLEDHFIQNHVNPWLKQRGGFLADTVAPALDVYSGGSPANVDWGKMADSINNGANSVAKTVGGWLGLGGYEDDDMQPPRRLQPAAEGNAPIYNGKLHITEDDTFYNDIMHPGGGREGMFARRPPLFTSSTTEVGALDIKHREYLMDLLPKNQAGFQTLTVIPVNPGLKDSFPLLARFGKYFEGYQFNQLIFAYRSTITPGNSFAAGTVMLNPIYNSNAAIATSKRSLESSSGSVSGKVTDDIICGIECDPKKLPGTDDRFVRSAPLPEQGDVSILDYDWCKLQVACQGTSNPIGPVPTVIGELWAFYNVTLRKLQDVNQPPIAPTEGFAFARHGITQLNNTDITLPYFMALALNSALNAPLADQKPLVFPLSDWVVNPNVNNVQPLASETLWSGKDGVGGIRDPMPIVVKAENIDVFYEINQVDPSNPGSSLSSKVSFTWTSVPGARYVFTCFLTGTARKTGLIVPDPLIGSVSTVPGTLVGYIYANVESGSCFVRDRKLNLAVCQLTDAPAYYSGGGPTPFAATFQASTSTFVTPISSAGQVTVSFTFDFSSVGNFNSNFEPVPSSFGFQLMRCDDATIQ